MLAVLYIPLSYKKQEDFHQHIFIIHRLLKLQQKKCFLV
uniref:Uncharacterized protein n=1 Tax=Anguilla anguilla TaxID=7936 RepID=A0A0E9UTA5_ANGAN